MPKLTATPEMKQAAIADEPKQHESPYGYRYVERTYYPYMNCVVQDGILKAAFYLPEHLRLDGNNPAYEVFLDKKAHQFLTYDHLEKKWRDAKLDRLNWPGRNYYATCWASEKDAAVVQDYLCGERGGDLGILDFQRNVRDEQLEQRHKRITGAWDQDLAQVPELPKDWMRWIDKVAVRENFIFYRYKRGGAQNGYCTFCGKEVPISGHPYHNKKGRCACCRHPIVFKALGRAGYIRTEKDYAYLIQRCKDGFVLREFWAERTYWKDSLPSGKPYWHEFRRSIYDRSGEIRSYYWGVYLELYYAFVDLVVHTSQEEKAWEIYRNIVDTQIWQQKAEGQNYFEAYNLRYPGEVLERFEEKLGKDVRIIRALALALGKTRALQSDNMFVGNQRGSFLQMIRRTSNGDVYLQGALYLLETDMPRRHALLDELAATEYAKTEDALFVLSLFDDQEEGYRTMHSQLLRLLGKERTLSLPENCGVLEWLVQHYAPYIKSYRGKSDLVLRTLTKFFRMNMKPDSREFSILTDAGYSGEEIILTNSLCVWADRIPDRISWNGTTAEKIASACCQMLLNQPDGLSEGLYAYVGWLFGRYERFAVQYNGYPNLWEAIKKELIPSAPQTMIWMLKTVKKEFPYRFDAFDPQYDILAKEVPQGDYWELFTDQMLCSCGKTPIIQWLARYRELTGADYCDGFQEWHRSSDRAFALLVERKEIRLWQFFEQHQEDGPSAQSMKLLLGYAMNISSWQGFRFVRRLLQKYTPVQLQKFFGEQFFFHELFVRGNRYSSRDYEFFIKRSFLTEEQHRQLFEWIEASFFQMEPKCYQEFIWCALQDSDVQRLYDRRLLASVLRSLLSSGKYTGGRADHLKEKFYSKEELEADQKADAEKAEREERLRREQEHQKKCERLEQTYDGTMSSLKEFTKSFYYDRDVKEALDMVYEKLREQPAGCAAAFAADELEQFFKLCGDLARYNPGDEQKILNMARTMMGGLAA